MMHELKRRGYNIFVGISEEKEIDFIAETKGKRLYVQVAYKMTEPPTIDREFTPLLEVRDPFPKYVVTIDDLWHDNIEGIEHKHIADFLLMEEF